MLHTCLRGSQDHRRRTPCLAAIAVAVAGAGLLALAGPAMASYSPASTQGWLTYNLPSGVNSSLTTKHTVQGRASGGVCQFTFTGSLAPGAAGFEEDEVAFDPSTCQAVYAVGPIQHPAAAAGELSTSASGATGDAAASGGDPAFYMKTFYEDPVGIDVTSLRNDLEWSYSGGCVRSYKWKRHATWYSPSGWGLNSVGDSPWLNCGSAGSNSHADMENNIFCAFTNTWTHYYYNHYVKGTPDGVAHYGWNDADSGACSGLLSHHYSVGWETPW